MPNLLLVMIGGALGAGARYAVAQLVAPALGWGTLFVNLAGALLMGLLAGRLGAASANPLWLFAGVGVLGGFTTFSAFSLDAVTLAQRGALVGAASYVTASVLGALGLFVLGLWLTRSPA